MLTLSNLYNDDDKIYYTTDGSTPTLNSPMYNWIASRWWSARADVLGSINRPIGPINENTTIKAITIGPGKMDSDVATFHYYVDDTDPDDGQEPTKDLKVIKLTIGRRQPISTVNPISWMRHLISILRQVARWSVRFISETLGAGVNGIRKPDR